MSKLSAFKTFRPLNLLIMALTMVLARHFLVLPVLQDAFRIGSAMEEWHFALLILATLLIAAAGYLINDHLDRGIDSINLPRKQTMPGFTNRRVEILYVVLNVLGITLGTAVAIQVENYKLAWIFVASAGLLYAYSSQLKKMPLVGTLAVGLLAGVVVLLPGIFETGLFTGDPVSAEAGRMIWFSLGCYAGFAFLTTLVREIIKDTEDMQGDKEYGRQTVPIVFGEKAAKFAVIILLLVTIRVLLIIQKQHLEGGDYYLPAYLAILVELPAFVIMVMMYRADRVKHYTRLSLIMKVIMVAGILSMPLYDVLA